MENRWQTDEQGDGVSGKCHTENVTGRKEALGVWSAEAFALCFGDRCVPFSLSAQMMSYWSYDSLRLAIGKTFMVQEWTNAINRNIFYPGKPILRHILAYFWVKTSGSVLGEDSFGDPWKTWWFFSTQISKIRSGIPQGGNKTLDSVTKERKTTGQKQCEM